MSLSDPYGEYSDSERPTNPVIPRAGRLPAFAREVPEVRYDLAYATACAMAHSGYSHHDYSWGYAGLSDAESRALSDARCALVMAGHRLGRGW